MLSFSSSLFYVVLIFNSTEMHSFFFAGRNKLMLMMMMVQLESLQSQLSVSCLFAYVVILHVLGGLFPGRGVEISNNPPYLVGLFGKF